MGFLCFGHPFRFFAERIRRNHYEHLRGGTHGEPEPIRASEVKRILGKVDELAELGEEVNVPFIVGETVTVIDGPFNSFSGIIEEIILIVVTVLSGVGECHCGSIVAI